METENAHNEGRTKEMVDEDKEIDERILSTEDILCADKVGVSTENGDSTEEQVESTDGHKKGTEEEIATQATQTSTQTPTSIIFGDDETIAKVLLNMSQAKAASREKGVIERKMQEEWEGEEERNRIAEEKAANEALIRNFDDIKARIEADRLLAEKLQEQERKHLPLFEEEQRNFKHAELKNQRSLRKYKLCMRRLRGQMKILFCIEKKSVIARLNKVSSPDGDYLVIYRANGNFRAFNYLMETVTLDGFELNSLGRLEEIMDGILNEKGLEQIWDGIVIHMLVERRYPLSKDLVQKMLDLGLEVERESSVALDLIRNEYLRKGRKTKPKPSTEWKSMEKTKSSRSQSPKSQPKSKKWSAAKRQSQVEAKVQKNQQSKSKPTMKNT
ncbi:hypothetical protein Tco_1210874 [Tanacetum coccineum]